MTSAIDSVLKADRTAIIEKWRAIVLAEYPEDTARLLKSQTDSFANPSGHVIKRALESLFDYLAGQTDRTAAVISIEELMRLRCVQAFSPSQSIGFIFTIKSMFREMEADGTITREEVATVDSKLDSIVLRAFDCYVQCREKISQIKIREAQDEKERITRVIKAMSRREARTEE